MTSFFECSHSCSLSGFFSLLFSFFLFFFQHQLRSKQICVVFIAFYFCCIKTSTNAFRLLENDFRFAIVCLFVCQRKEVFSLSWQKLHRNVANEKFSIQNQFSSRSILIPWHSLEMYRLQEILKWINESDSKRNDRMKRRKIYFLLHSSDQ